MRSRAIINLRAVRANYVRLLAITGGRTNLMCVVKADAYGHGAVSVSRALSAAGARHFAVATLDEGVRLRDGGVGGSVVVLGGLEAGTEREAVLRGIESAVGTIGELERLNDAARMLGRRLSCHLLLNTGMNRLGIDFDPGRPASASRLHEAIRASEWLEVRGAGTHYACSEDFLTRRTERQSRRFARQVDALRSAGVAPRYVHAANSAAVVYRGIGGIGDPLGHTMVRPGLALYGYVKEARGRSFRSDPVLRPVLEWRARLVRIRDVPSGAGIGYGPAYVAKRPTRIGVLAVGYADGYDSRLSNRGWVVVRGATCEVLGEISMDLTLVDLSGCPDAEVGDEATLVGRRPYGAMTMAQMIKGSVYEVLCGISARVPRVYVDRASARRRG